MNYSKNSVSKSRAFIEATYPALMVILWVWFEPFGRNHYISNAFIALNIVILLGIVYVEGAPSLKESGIILRPELQIQAIKEALVIVCCGVAILLGIGFISDSIVWKPGLLKSIFVYPLWALMQDAVVLVFILPRARITFGSYGEAYTALLFTIIHLPSPALTIAAFVLAAVMIAFWKKYQSLIAIAFVHGILGAVANKTLDFSMRIGKAWFGSH